MLHERHVNTSSAVLDGSLTKWSPHPPPLLLTTHSSMQSRDAQKDSLSPIGSHALRGCLDLLVKVQRTQAESVDLLQTLCVRLFPRHPTSTNASSLRTALMTSEGAEPLPSSPRAVLGFDEVDREVVRLRILEVKHAGLNPKLSNAIETVMSPFQVYLRQEATRLGRGASLTCDDVSAPLWEACGRVSGLREQLMGLAQLQEEAMQSLGAQLTTLFTRPDGKIALYYYPTPLETTGNSNADKSLSVGVRQFLDQLLDVMGSKQHLVVCLATSLRDIYDPAVAPLPREASYRAGSCISVTVSPSSTAPREPSYQSPQTEDRTWRGEGSPPPRVDSHMEKTRTTAWEKRLSTDVETCKHEIPKPHTNQTEKVENEEEEEDMSPVSGIPRSPSCVAVTGSSPIETPPPLARCPQEEARGEPPLVFETSRPSLCVTGSQTQQPNGTETPYVTFHETPTAHETKLTEVPAREGNAGEAPHYPSNHHHHPHSASLYMNTIDTHDAPTGEASPRSMGRTEPRAEECYTTEGARLRRLLDAKDGMILTLQEQLIGVVVPALTERAESLRSAAHTSATSSRHSSTAPTSRRESEEQLRPQSEHKQKQLEEQEDEDDGEEEARQRKRQSRRVEELCAMHEEELSALRDALREVRGEKQQWKRTARELKEDNKTLRSRLSAEREHRAQLEADRVLLKKRLLVLEAAATAPVFDNSLQPTSSPSCRAALRSAPHHSSASGTQTGVDDAETPFVVNVGNVNTSPSPPRLYRGRSRTQAPHVSPLPSEEPRRNALWAKRSELLARLRHNSPEGEGEDPMVVVSPLTDERPVTNGGVTPSRPSLSMNDADGIERRLSPEYFTSPPPAPVSTLHNTTCTTNATNTLTGTNKNAGMNRSSSISSNNSRGSCTSPGPPLSTADVNRILSSARSLLRSVRAQKHNRSRGSSSDTSDAAWTDDDDIETNHKRNVDTNPNKHARDNNAASNLLHSHVRAMEVPVRRLRRSSSPANGALSPCSSVSYSSAKKRAHRLASSPPQGKPFPQEVLLSPQPTQRTDMGKRKVEKENGTGAAKQHHEDGKARSEETNGGNGERRPGTAREAMMRELREQLIILRGQHDGVQQQAEQLRRKRQQVTATFQKQIQDSLERPGKGTSEVGELRKRLNAFLHRFDVTEAKVQKNALQLAEYLDIVQRQLKTLEDDAL